MVLHLCLILTPESLAAESSILDGQWWQSISESERLGFLAGYIDCYKYEYVGPDKYLTKSFQAYADMTTQFYSQNSEQIRLPVKQVIHKFRDMSERSVSNGGESVNGKHGYFDGLYWMQINAIGGLANQVAFITGYLNCYRDFTHDRKGTFDASPSEYASRITSYYHFDEKSGDIDAARQSLKIADVLFIVRSHRPKPQSQAK